ncbi:MAG: HAMP domain-containing protein [Gammaproteobacteria bacterium]|nr:HAMP domain-containing protein [Gammaproteobacteria bacterium]
MRKIGITAKKNKFIFNIGYFVAFITLLALFLLSQATQESKKFEEYYLYLLITTVIGIGCLFVMVITLLWKTFRNYKNSIAGASLSLTILGRTLSLSIIPLILITFFSFKFLRYEFQSSFDKGINDALNNALVLSQKALNVRALQALQKSKNIALLIAPYEYTTLQANLEVFRRKIDATELTVFDEKGFIQAFSSSDPHIIIPLIPEHSDFIRVENESGIFVIEPEKDKFKIRVLTNINKPGSPNYYLQSLFYIPDTVSELTDQINKTVTERDKFNYLMPRVNNSFIFVLLLVLLLSCLLLILSSIGFANDMVQPIRDLIRGTKNISQGDFNKKIYAKRNDDFGTLINSFNQMMVSLKKATEEADINREKVESERAYLATVINHMNSAVITLDFKGRMLTYNERAEKLLACPLDEAISLEREEFGLQLEHYKSFISQFVLSNKEYHSSEIEIEIEIAQSEITKQFVASVTALPSTDNMHGGYVIIFDEFGNYLQKQKQQAWEEVARRLAHEIKNPLTPILLAAERLNYKLSGHLQEKEQKVLTRSIDVISNQVRSLKNMVDDFSNYAKPDISKKTSISLNLLIKDVFALYQGHYKNIHFDLLIHAEEDSVKANPNLLRQVLHNIIKNSIEACGESTNSNISITSLNIDSSINIEIKDNGTGLLSTKNDIFEPYMTTKEKGTGLGLAIVKKIISDHNGEITLSNRTDEQGVIVSIILPLSNQQYEY